VGLFEVELLLVFDVVGDFGELLEVGFADGVLGGVLVHL
jgi:hypothetical protein